MAGCLGATGSNFVCGLNTLGGISVHYTFHKDAAKELVVVGMPGSSLRAAAHNSWTVFPIKKETENTLPLVH